MTGRTVNINLIQIISLYDKFNFHFFAGCCFGGRVLAAITLAAKCVILAPVLPIFFGNPISVIIDITIRSDEEETGDGSQIDRQRQVEQQTGTVRRRSGTGAVRTARHEVAHRVRTVVSEAAENRCSTIRLPAICLAHVRRTRYGTFP